VPVVLDVSQGVTLGSRFLRHRYHGPFGPHGGAEPRV